MATLASIKPSISEMSAERALNLVLLHRAGRRVPVDKVKLVKDKTPKKVVDKKSSAVITPQMAAELLRQITEGL